MNHIQQLGLEAEIAFVRSLAVDKFENDKVLAIYDGLGDPLLSVVINTQCKAEELDEVIESVRAFYQRKKIDWAWIVSPLNKPEPTILAEQLAAKGFVLVDEYPGMYLSLEQELTPLAQSALEIQELEAQDQLKQWIKPVGSAFPPTKDQGEGYRSLLVEAGHGPATAFRHYLGLYQNQAVCGGTLFIHGDLVMIHNIATGPEFQRQGFGSQMTCHLMHCAKALGAKHCFLDASLKGKEVYSRLGFEVYALQQTYKLKQPYF